MSIFFEPHTIDIGSCRKDGLKACYYNSKDGIGKFEGTVSYCGKNVYGFSKLEITYKNSVGDIISKVEQDVDVFGGDAFAKAKLKRGDIVSFSGKVFVCYDENEHITDLSIKSVFNVKKIK